tara:strand:+ start:112 stop:1272 length:1161 start_codon:yes stop_codon:yes gene_type:complete
MKFNTFIENHSQLNKIKKTSIREVILEHKSLSRYGKNGTKLLISLAEESLSSKISPLLQWDILSTENSFQKSINVINQLPLKIFHAVRVQDIGAAQWIKKEHPKIPIQLILETGNHNLTGMHRLSEYFGKQLKRIILSAELPKSKIIEYSRSLSIDCELLCVGRILLFYSPRKLLSKYRILNNSNDFLEENIFSENQPQKKFPAIENQHGTFMFFNRDLFLLDFLPELKNSGLSFLRIDLRHMNRSSKWIKKLDDIIKNFNKNKIDELKSLWPARITHGFFRANRTDLAIKRIKNPFLQNHSENLVGYVLESVKEQHIILIARKTFKCGELLTAITPEGRKCIIFTDNIKTSNGIPVDEIQPEKLYQVPHVKYVTAQTLIYRSNKS